MASYSIATSAIALGVNRKRLENLLLRTVIPGTSRGRQGRVRRLSRPSLLFLATLVELQERFAIPARVASEIAAELLSSDSRPVQRGVLTIAVDVQQLDAALTASLGLAMEVAPRPRRGRPRRSSTG